MTPKAQELWDEWSKLELHGATPDTTMRWLCDQFAKIHERLKGLERKVNQPGTGKKHKTCEHGKSNRYCHICTKPTEDTVDPAPRYDEIFEQGTVALDRDELAEQFSEAGKDAEETVTLHESYKAIEQARREGYREGWNDGQESIIGIPPYQSRSPLAEACKDIPPAPKAGDVLTMEDLRKAVHLLTGNPFSTPEKPEKNILEKLAELSDMIPDSEWKRLAREREEKPSRLDEAVAKWRALEPQQRAWLLDLISLVSGGETLTLLGGNLAVVDIRDKALDLLRAAGEDK